MIGRGAGSVPGERVVSSWVMGWAPWAPEKEVFVDGGRGDSSGQAQSRRRYFWAGLRLSLQPILALTNAYQKIAIALLFSTLVESDKGGITRPRKLLVEVSCALFLDFKAS